MSDYDNFTIAVAHLARWLSGHGVETDEAEFVLRFKSPIEAQRLDNMLRNDMQSLVGTDVANAELTRTVSDPDFVVRMMGLRIKFESYGQ